MRNLLALLALAVIVFAGLGWWLDWYQIRSQTGITGNQSVNIDINGSKISSDVRKGIQKLEEKKQRFENTAQDAAQDASRHVDDLSRQIPKTQE